MSRYSWGISYATTSWREKEKKRKQKSKHTERRIYQRRSNENTRICRTTWPFPLQPPTPGSRIACDEQVGSKQPDTQAAAAGAWRSVPPATVYTNKQTTRARRARGEYGGGGVVCPSQIKVQAVRASSFVLPISSSIRQKDKSSIYPPWYGVTSEAKVGEKQKERNKK